MHLRQAKKIINSLLEPDSSTRYTTWKRAVKRAPEHLITIMGIILTRRKDDTVS